MVQTRSSVEIAHHRAITPPIQEIASTLDRILTRRLTACITGVQSGRTVRRWATGEVVEIRDHETEQRLRTAYEIVLRLFELEHPTTIRSWSIEMNPYLDDQSPADVIRDGQCHDAIPAARLFLAHG